MKMPSINIAFKEKGISAVERSERGIVLLILKEETLPSQTEMNLYTADDIPKELSDSNREQLELTLRGYVNSPKKVIAQKSSARMRRLYRCPQGHREQALRLPGHPGHRRKPHRHHRDLDQGDADE